MSGPSSTQDAARSSSNTQQSKPAATGSLKSQYNVPPIPAFKGGSTNYAAAASKSKPSPATVNGKEAGPAVIGQTSQSSPAAAAMAAVTSPKVASGNVNLPQPTKDTINFGTVNDKNAQGPPKSNGNNGTPSPAPTSGATKPAINMHAFFTGGGSSSSSQPPQQPARSPQPTPSPVPSAHGLSSSSAAFAPRQQQPSPAFVPQQAQQFTSPSPQFQPYSGAGNQQAGSPYMAAQQQPAVKPTNIPNGSASPYPSSAQPPSGAAGSRPGSYVGSPVMQAPQGGRPAGGRPSFTGPTSPRMPNVSVAGVPPMMYPQHWQGQPGYAQYGAQQFYPSYGYPAYAAAQGGGPSYNTSGASTPSTQAGIRTPATAPSAGLPTSPSPSLTSASTAYTNMTSPQLQSANTTGGGHHTGHQNPYAPHALGSTPLRALSSAINASEFKPGGGSPSSIGGVDATTFTPTPRKSAAIKIRNPKEVAAEKEKAAAAAAAAEAAKTGDVTTAATGGDDKKVQDNVSVEADKKQKEQQEADAAAVAAKQKAQDEQAAANKTKADEEAAAAQKKKAEEEAAAAAAATAEAEKKKKAEQEEEERIAKEKAQQEADAAEAKRKADALAAAEKEQEQQKKQAEAKAKVDAEAAAAKDKEASDKAANDAAVKPAAGAVEALKKEEGVVSEVQRADTPGPDAAPVNGSTEDDAKAANKGPSPLSTARAIDNLTAVSYPDNIKSPRAELNAGAEPGKYRYDREFLMQFMNVCVERPDNLPNLESIGMVDAGAEVSGGRGAFGGGNRRSPMGPPSGPSRSGSSGGLGRSTSGGGVGGGFGGMGNFGQATLGSSEARFAASLGRSPSGAYTNRPGSMSRTSSQSGMGGFVPAGGRTTSSRGGKRRQGGGGDDGGRRGGDKHVTGDGFENATLAPRSETGWAPTVVSGAPQLDANSPEMVQRKVKALLNKLTLERFNSISDQILEWADKSADETDGRILRQVIALIFEKATDEANFSEMYARLCRKLMESISPKVTDESVKDSSGKGVAGGALFRKYLLNRCQEDYEAGWKAKETAAAAAAATAAEDKAKQEANDAADKEAADKNKAPSKEAELMSDEYYAAQKAKRRGLGLVRFIGELYRLSMLTERIMHECIRKLLANTSDPDEEDIESLTRLLTTVGGSLDNPKAKQHMDIYFERMKTIAESPKVSSRMRFMILDVVDLRSDKWQNKKAQQGPKLISEVHADAQREADESARRVASSGGKGLPRLHDQLSRPNSRRGQGRDGFGVGQTGGPDGWSQPVPQRPAKAGDLSSFGKIREQSGTISLGPSGAFANRQKAKEAARPATPSNPFALLSGSTESAEPAPEEQSQRPKLKLKPRTKPLDGEEGEGEDEEEEAEENEDDDDGAIDPNASSLSRSEAERRAGNSVKEFFAVKNVQEGVLSIEALPAEYRGFLIKSLADAALEKKDDDVNVTRTLFAEAITKDIMSHEAMIDALRPVINGIVDIAIDVPNAYKFACQLLLGVGVSRAELEDMAKTMESEEGEEEVEYGRESLLAAYDKLNAQ
ncbi:hypothetical protein OIO90_004436 [Microbotryomycetes sp. JL221]|nr:hypothetical protein OIO90_004436 [Microbotryomycetes sp. JL221]